MQAQRKHMYVMVRSSQPGSYLWYLIRVGKLVPVSQCRKLLRGTGYISSMMLRQQAHPHPAPTLQTHPGIKDSSRLSSERKSANRADARPWHNCYPDLVFSTQISTEAPHRIPVDMQAISTKAGQRALKSICCAFRPMSQQLFCIFMTII